MASSSPRFVLHSASTKYCQRKPFDTRHRSISEAQATSCADTKEVHPAWIYARVRLPHEPERNRHYQKLFYCKQCDYCQPIQNAEQHLRSSHGVRLQRITASPILGALRRQKEKGELQSRTAQENCFSKSCTNAVFRDALARFTVRANISHRVV